MKKTWLTSMASTKDSASQVVAGLQKYGLAVEGHIWEDDNDKLAWMNALESLVNPQISLWAIIGSGEEIANPAVLYGLSMLVIAVRSKRKSGLPVVILQADKNHISEEDLPTFMDGVEVLNIDNPALGAKLVAKAHATSSQANLAYHLGTHCNEQIGQWFEVGPKDELWQGTMFGVTGGEIEFQAVGPSGKLPEKSILEYPIQEMKLTLGKLEYTTWAVQNELNMGESYFAKVKGHPDSIIFGPYSAEKETDVFVVRFR